jgi:hypothetical protein
MSVFLFATCFAAAKIFPSVVYLRPRLVTPFPVMSAMPGERTGEQIEVCGVSQVLKICQRTVPFIGILPGKSRQNKQKIYRSSKLTAKFPVRMAEKAALRG